MSALIETIVSWALGLISQFGYWGIFVTMGLDSAAIPIPSEVVLPFAGFLASNGQLHLWTIVFVATLSNVVGSIVIYFVGHALGKPILERYGKYIFLHKSEIVKVDNWLKKNERKAVFYSRLMPGVRTYSALIMGAVNNLKMGWFIMYTALGSFIWNFAFTYFGFAAGEKWDILEPYFRKIELVLAGIIIIFVIWFIHRHIKKSKHL